MPKYNFPGTTSYGQMGPMTKKEMDKIPMRNKDIKKLESKFKVGPSGMPYNPAYQTKKKVTA